MTRHTQTPQHQTLRPNQYMYCALPTHWASKSTESALATRNVQQLSAKPVADAKQGKQREAKGNNAKECQARQATPAKPSNAK